MIYEILADIVVGIHLAYVSYVVFGELLIVIGIPLGWQWIRNFWFRVSHLIMILIVALEAVFRIQCPLTTWETQLQEAAGMEFENRSFVGRLMHNLFIFDCPDESWVWPWVYGGVAGIIVLTFVIAPPRWNGKQPQIIADERR